MLYTQASEIDLSKYNRFFVFGCSFTNYRWPTWADILHKEMPQGTEYYNFARSGAGQQYISATLSQAINKYKIAENDFVAIMWSTFYREDRYKWQNFWNNWATPGNIFSQDTYNQEFIDKYCCLRGFHVRDLSIIDLTMRAIKNESFDSIAALGVPIKSQNFYSGQDQEDFENVPLDDLVTCYRHLDRMLMPDLMTAEFPNGWENEYVYFDDGQNAEFQDYHPSVFRYMKYLEKCGFNFSDPTKVWVGEQHVAHLNKKHKSEFTENSPEILY